MEANVRIHSHIPSFLGKQNAISIEYVGPRDILGTVEMSISVAHYGNYDYLAVQCVVQSLFRLSYPGP
jgi:hypothetical protein